MSGKIYDWDCNSWKVCLYLGPFVYITMFLVAVSW